MNHHPRLLAAPVLAWAVFGIIPASATVTGTHVATFRRQNGTVQQTAKVAHGTAVAVREAIGNQFTEIRTSPNIVQAFDTSFYVEATLATVVLNGGGRSGQPLSGQPVKFEINGGTWVQNTDENGKVRFGPFVHWPIRTSTGTIRFEGAQGLSPCSESVTVAITKAASQFTLSSTNLVVGTFSPKKLVVWLKDSHNAGLTNQTVTMLINGTTFTLRTDEQGRMTWSPTEFRAGTYTTRFSFAGSATHEPTSRTVMLHLIWAVQIGAPNKTFNVSSRKKRYAVSFKYYTGKAIANKRIRVKIDGKTYTKKTNAKGRATLNLVRLKKGTYKIVVYFPGGNGYFALNKTATIKIVGSQATQLAVPDETYFSSATNKLYTAYLQTKNEFLEKETLTFTIDGKTYTKKTDAKGRATLRLPSMKKGNHKVTVKYAGRGGYKPSKKTAKVTISGAKTLPMLTARNKTYSIKATDLLYTATLKTPDGLACRNGTIKFTINGKTYTAKTDAKGHATISLPQLDEGVYPMVVKYPGSSKYPASIKTVKITIKQ